MDSEWYMTTNTMIPEEGLQVQNAYLLVIIMKSEMQRIFFCVMT